MVQIFKYGYIIGRATKKRKRVIIMWCINRIVDDGEIKLSKYVKG